MKKLYSFILVISLLLSSCFLPMAYAENASGETPVKDAQVENGTATDSQDKDSNEDSTEDSNGDQQPTENECTEHVYNEGEVVAPTCTEKGYTKFTCKNCGDTYNDNETEALGHEYDEGQVVLPTCIAEGYTQHNCKNCEYFYRDQFVSALGHEYSEPQIVVPTCTEKGYTQHNCKNCEYFYRDEEVDALGHTLVLIEAKEATCTEDGNTVGVKCSTCNDTVLLEPTIISKLGHKYGEPQWSFSGKKAVATFKCENKNCGDTQKVTDEKAGTVTSATMSKDGVIVYNASVTFNGKTYKKNCKSAIAKIATVSLSKSTFYYNGKVQKPTVTVTDSNGKKLKLNTDYTVKYSDGCKALGTYDVKVTFKGNYKGSNTQKFKITLGKVTNLKAKDRTLSWSKVAGAKNYKVYLYNSSTKKYQLLETTTKTTFTIPKEYKCGNFSAYVVAVNGKVTGSKSAVCKFKTSHSWDSHSANCLKCNAKDSVVKYKSITMSPNKYKVNEKYKSTLTLTVQGKYHTYTLVTKKAPNGFTTKTPGKKTIVFNGYGGVKCSYTVTK